MADKEFVDGLIVKAPHEKAPEFVKCTLSIKRKDLGNWLRGKTDEWINVDVKVSQKGTWYCEVNNWKPKAEKSADHKFMGADPKPDPKPMGKDFDDIDIPF